MSNKDTGKLRAASDLEFIDKLFELGTNQAVADFYGCPLSSVTVRRRGLVRRGAAIPRRIPRPPRNSVKELNEHIRARLKQTA